MYNRIEIIAGLRELADFLESNPEVHPPYVGTMLHVFSDKEEFVGAMRAIGVGKKVYDDTNFIFRKDFRGGVNYSAFIARAQVCEAKVVGTRIIPAVTVPAQPERVIEERTEDIIEWECMDSLLAPKVQDTAEEHATAESEEAPLEIPF